MKTKSQLGLEQLSQREVPAAFLGGDEPCGNSVRIEIPGGCWPGPPPVMRVGEIGQIAVQPAESVFVGALASAKFM